MTPHRLALAQAIAAHSAWKVRLREGVAHGGAGLRAPDVARDDRCELGRCLIRLEAAGSAPRAGLEAIRQLHARFHLAAGELVALCQAGRTREALEALEPGGSFAELSSELVGRLSAWADADLG